MEVAPGRIAFGAAAVVSVVFVVLAARLRRRAAEAPATALDDAIGPERRRAAGRRFGLVVLAEWIGIFVIAHALGSTGHSDAIPAVVAFAVGVHFFPLARLFHVQAYWVTGSVLCLVAVTAAVLASLTSTPALWTLLPGFGSALTLYVTSAWLLPVRDA